MTEPQWTDSNTALGLLHDDNEHVRKTLHTHANALMELRAKVSDLTKGQTRLDDGQLEILRKLDANNALLTENTAVTHKVAASTAGLVEFSESLLGIRNLLERVSRWAKPVTVIVALIATMLTAWGAYSKLS